MAGKGQYLVGPTQAYQSLSEAVLDLRADQGAAQFSSPQEIIIAEAGVYEGVRIEPGSLAPTPVNRLTIRGAQGINPIITETETIDRPVPVTASLAAICLFCRMTLPEQGTFEVAMLSPDADQAKNIVQRAMWTQGARSKWQGDDSWVVPELN